MDNQSKNNSNLITCTHCGADISKGAKTCPSCGGKNKKPIYKRPWFIVIIAILVIGVVGSALGGGDSNTNTSSNDEPQKAEKKIEYTEHDIKKMHKELEANALKAEEKYQDKYIEITGKLGTIDSDGSYICIETNEEYSFDDIQCYIEDDKQLKQIKELNKGDSVTIQGQVTEIGELLGYSMDIDKIL
ncbi:MAG: zinc-ribbon domain-containing protein [Bacilli bacterium]